MSGDPVRAIADAVLYEGYLLWPYRRSALKNQQRFTFGGVYPRAFASLGNDRARIRMECLVEVEPGAALEVVVRCLHLVDRQPMRREADRLYAVDELVAGGQRHLAFQEASEREQSTGWLAATTLLASPKEVCVEVAADEVIERLPDNAALVRRWQPLRGALAVGAVEVGPGLLRVSVAFENRSGWGGDERSRALARTFLSTHLIVRARAGAFVSQTDPPPDLAHLVGGCANQGVWPVLVGEPGARDTMLGSPIILEDYPSVAPESPGDLFDGAEIDALLIHSIRALTERERDEMRATDPRTSAILTRSMTLPPEHMERLYGAVRDMRRVEG